MIAPSNEMCTLFPTRITTKTSCLITNSTRELFTTFIK